MTGSLHTAQTKSRNQKHSQQRGGKPREAEILCCTAEHLQLLENRELQPPGTEFALCVFSIELHFLYAEKHHKPDGFTNFMKIWTKKDTGLWSGHRYIILVSLHRTVKTEAPAALRALGTQRALPQPSCLAKTKKKIILCCNDSWAGREGFRTCQLLNNVSSCQRGRW